MPEITIEEATFARLQNHAKPFVDTPDAVINRALDALEQNPNSASPPVSSGLTRQIDARNLPDLTHTKVLDAFIDGRQIQKPNWNRLVDEMLRRARARAGSVERLRQLCPVNMVSGRKEDEGYGYLPDIDLSVQGQDANAACRAVLTAAQALQIGLDVTFMWRPKDGAAYPGERARLKSAGAPGTVQSVGAVQSAA